MKRPTPQAQEHQVFGRRVEFSVNIIPAIYRRGTILCCLFVAAIGCFLAVLPHLSVLYRRGSWVYLADTDDVLYVSIARDPIAGSWEVGDHHSPLEDPLPSTYAWLQFLPVSRLVGSVGLPAPYFMLAWRAIAGLFLGPSIFLLLSSIVRSLGWSERKVLSLATVFTLLCLADPGFRTMVPLLRFSRFAQVIASGDYTRSNPNEYVQYRILSPLTGLPFVFLFLWRLMPGKSRSVAAATFTGTLFGTLIGLYFFFWTFAAALLASLIGWHLLRWAFGGGEITLRKSHGSEARFASLALAIGLALGSPQIASNALTTRLPGVKNALERTPRIIQLERSNPFRWNYISNKTTFFGTIMVIGAFCWLRTPGMGLLVAGFIVSAALQCSAFVTGVEFENYKWGHISGTLGYIILLIITAAVFDRVSRRCDGRHFRSLLLVFIAGVVVLLCSAALFIWRGAVESTSSSRLSMLDDEFQPMHMAFAHIDPTTRVAGPDELMVPALYSQFGILYGEHTFQSLISDSELIERFALSHWIMGTSAEELLSLYPYGLPPDGVLIGERRQRWEPSIVRAEMVRRFSSFRLADADRYRVSAVLLPAGRPPQPNAGPWILEKQSGRWKLWTRQISKKAHR